MHEAGIKAETTNEGSPNGSLQDPGRSATESMIMEIPEDGCLIRAVIFDMDGTLIDTEKYYRRFWPMAMAEFGYVMSEEQALAIRSLGRPFAPVRMRQWFGEQLDYEAVRQRRKELMEPFLKREGIERKPGALELLTDLKRRKMVTAVATATDMERTREYLGQVKLLPYFDEIISATLVPEGKPSPDIYLYACEKLGLPPGECLAVEDSPNGVLSAYRAGCPVIMVPDQTGPEELTEYLYACVDSLADITDFLDRLPETGEETVRDLR